MFFACIAKVLFGQRKYSMKLHSQHAYLLAYKQDVIQVATQTLNNTQTLNILLNYNEHLYALVYFTNLKSFQCIQKLHAYDLTGMCLGKQTTKLVQNQMTHYIQQIPIKFSFERANFLAEFYV